MESDRDLREFGLLTVGVPFYLGEWVEKSVGKYYQNPCQMFVASREERVTGSVDGAMLVRWVQETFDHCDVPGFESDAMLLLLQQEEAIYGEEVGILRVVLPYPYHIMVIWILLCKQLVFRNS